MSEVLKMQELAKQVRNGERDSESILLTEVI